MTRRLLLMLLLCALPTSTMADEHRFAVDDVWFARNDNGYALRADMSAGPGELIQQLLQSGYAVKLSFELRFMRQRDWLPDKEIGDITWTPQISHDPLLSRYTFLAAGGTEEEFPALDDALLRAGRLRASPESGERFARLFELTDVYILARYVMSISHLPQPLQVSLLTGDYDIDSGWQRFALEARP